MLLTRCIPDAHSEYMLGLPTPALTCARWGVHLQDNFPDRVVGGGGPCPVCRPPGAGGGCWGIADCEKGQSQESGQEYGRSNGQGQVKG